MGFSQDDIQEFCQEATELLEAAEESLLSLDKGGEFQVNYDAIFRAFHSTKGGAGMMELTALQAHMHQLENLLVQCKANSQIPKPHIDFFLRGIDGAKEIMEGKTIQFDYKISSANTVSEVAKPTAKVVPIKKKEKVETLGNVVVVDDEPQIVEILSDMLKDAGFKVTAFNNPVEAIDFINKSAVDMVFTDFNMPQMTGHAMATEIRKKHPELPIVIVSGHVKSNVVLQGIYAIIEKPFKEDLIIQFALHATKRYQMNRLLNRAIDLLMYQFSDLDDFLKAQGKEEVRKTLTAEINSIIELRGKIRELNKKQAA